ncbi:TetR/AcrR family transcriptional regulator [Pseudonocardia sp. KRD291]|uniref:TetR/AcrR family transcriptional regulator n=1 Tax=Pseudonocardia sp. KRD291 TaxID=2792007 RepID=UPI001C4A16D0|nr:TetR/AcrR family transcriptional regulator [Pseudonocardia sp. KRD291]MBW0102476.1 TetR/AcrR family transcriptional regulator [Pseudonocardia sp. KRD291]
MTTSEPSRRPGGRSARVRADVHTATRALLAEDRWAQLTLGGIAERAGTSPSTLYRRWGDLGALLSEVLDARLAETSPLPDTGTLTGDLHRWGAGMASDLDGPEGRVLLRGSLLLSGEDDGDRPPDQARRGRVDEIEALISRARTRGEPVPTVQDVFEFLIGPLYGYALFARGALVARAPALVDRLLEHAGRS